MDKRLSHIFASKCVRVCERVNALGGTTSDRLIGTCTITTMDKIHQEYQFGRELGKGAFGSVHEGIHKQSGKRYAIKVVEKSKLTSCNWEVVDNEIKILSTLDHPNVLKMYGHYFEPEKVYMVTELCEGGELFDRILSREYYSEADAQAVLRSIASALQLCHSKRIVHRDLKPENILMLNQEFDSPIKIADFGFATTTEDGYLTTALGTPTYMAPEIIQRKPYDFAVDVWSFGVIAFVLLCGYPPFYSDKQQEVYRRITECEYQFESPHWDLISVDAKDLISKLLVLDPAARPTIEEVMKHEWMQGKLEEKDITPALDELRTMQSRRQAIRSAGTTLTVAKMQVLVEQGESST